MNNETPMTMPLGVPMLPFPLVRIDLCCSRLRRRTLLFFHRIVTWPHRTYPLSRRRRRSSASRRGSERMDQRSVPSLLVRL